jgi:hypothetical protein
MHAVGTHSPQRATAAPRNKVEILWCLKLESRVCFLFCSVLFLGEEINERSEQAIAILSLALLCSLLVSPASPILHVVKSALVSLQP